MTDRRTGKTHTAAYHDSETAKTVLMQHKVPVIKLHSSLLVTDDRQTSDHATAKMNSYRRNRFA